MSSNRHNKMPHNPHGMKTVNLTDIWEDLSNGIHHIYSRQNMPKKRYMGLYTYPKFLFNKWWPYQCCGAIHYCAFLNYNSWI